MSGLKQKKKAKAEENMQRYFLKRSSAHGQLKMSCISATDDQLPVSFTLWFQYAFRLPSFNNFIWVLTHILNLISNFFTFSKMPNTRSHTVTGLSRLSCTLLICLVVWFPHLCFSASLYHGHLLTPTIKQGLRGDDKDDSDGLCVNLLT